MSLSMHASGPSWNGPDLWCPPGHGPHHPCLSPLRIPVPDGGLLPTLPASSTSHCHVGLPPKYPQASSSPTSSRTTLTAPAPAATETTALVPTMLVLTPQMDKRSQDGGGQHSSS